MLPSSWHRARARRLLATLDSNPLDEFEQRRLDHYIKLDQPFRLMAGETVGTIPRGRSYYYYDLRRSAAAFNPHMRLFCRFGDITTVAAEPSIVKSRPIDGDNANSVLMKLDALRHFSVLSDPVPFDAKRPAAVWRGDGKNPLRRALVRAHGRSPRHDIAYVGKPLDGLGEPGQFLSKPDHMRFRYIISLEGNDVATNLKWIMASNSLCLMPKPKYETWFAEGLLMPGLHYAEMRPDFADLDEVVDHYERHPEEARAVIANAQAHVALFQRRQREDILSLLVLSRYLELANSA
ncbi:glycosyl transferase family 90 [Hoeflea marina]|uniref:Glycosyl transferase family 90 n=2 Tax=Hoeflea marina TaxID=274592 RepID=A0A317PLU4_9HYPH|nr:glycosyl transferase family 90 [Hoeflea marina]